LVKCDTHTHYLIFTGFGRKKEPKLKASWQREFRQEGVTVTIPLLLPLLLSKKKHCTNIRMSNIVKDANLKARHLQMIMGCAVVLYYLN